MKNLLFVAVLLLTVSGFAKFQMPPCDDGDTRSSVSVNTIHEAGDRLMKLGFEGTNQTAEISRLRAKIAEAKTKATYVQDLAIDALSNKHMDIRAAVAVCPSERDGSLKNIQDATEVIFNIRALIATEAKAK